MYIGLTQPKNHISQNFKKNRQKHGVGSNAQRDIISKKNRQISPKHK